MLQKKKLRAEGYLLLKDFFSKEKIDLINTKIEHFFENNECLGPAVNVAGLSSSELLTYGHLRKKAIAKNPDYMINQELVQKGDKQYRNLTIGQNIEEPLLNVPEILELIVNKDILALVTNYFDNKKVKIGYVKIRRYFANDAPNFDTNHFHIDDNGQDLVKAIIYLSDIKNIDDGVFCYVPKSKSDVINEPSESQINPHLRSDEQIHRYYGDDSVDKIFASSGSVVIADTLGFHKGTKTKTKDRTVLYVNYVLEEEYGGAGARQKVSEKHFINKPELLEIFEYFDLVNSHNL